MRMLWRLAWGQKGAGLLETVVAVSFAGTAVAAGIGLTAIGVVAGGSSNERNVASILARSEMESILSGPYRSAGDYPTISVEGFTVQVLTEDVTPGLLQKVTVRVRLGPGRDTDRIAAEIESFKANRYLTGGERPAPGGLEFARSITIPDLNGRTGFYYVVDIIPSAVLSVIGGRWQLSIDPKKGLSGEERDLSITIYRGMPFGEGSGLSSISPLDVVGSTVVGLGKTKDVDMEVATRGQWGGKFTLYFFNETQGKQASTANITVTCICP